MRRFLTTVIAVILCFSMSSTSMVYAAETSETSTEDIVDLEEQADSEEQVDSDVQSDADELFDSEDAVVDGEDTAASETRTEVKVELDIKSPTALLMEASTGQVIYEKDAHTKRSPASVTKIMTMLLIFDALDSGQIQLTDLVVTSAHAKSMGGSQVYLEEGEKQTVETLIKCIVIASGNDAAVSMAEFISGSEQEFVKSMNERALGLGMTNTNFEDSCGLTESATHYTTAYDIALMSRELIINYPQVEQYATIWMENITHTTAQGTSEFGLSNTNKLLKSYDGITGLKTGYTRLAMFCISATARRDGIDLISVIMAAPDSKTRNKDAATMLTYGFGKCSLFKDVNEEVLPNVAVANGVEEEVAVVFEADFTYLELNGETLTTIAKEIEMNRDVTAPIEEGSIAGRAIYYRDGQELGSVNILYANAVEKADFIDYFRKALKKIGV